MEFVAKYDVLENDAIVTTNGLRRFWVHIDAEEAPLWRRSMTRAKTTHYSAMATGTVLPRPNA
jgi:hypothetical protein